MFHVASLITIGPGEEILFSLPVNHLNKNWHIEIPFNFELPQGKGPRDPLNRRAPHGYSLFNVGFASKSTSRHCEELVIFCQRISVSAREVGLRGKFVVERSASCIERYSLREFFAYFVPSKSPMAIRLSM